MKNLRLEFRTLFAVSLLISGSFSSGQGIEATVTGTAIDLASQKLSQSVKIVEPSEGGTSLEVSGTAGKQLTLHLFNLDGPVIDSDGYAVAGEVRYEGVEGDGFLEMWNHLPAEKGGSEIGASFFSRTLAVSGPMAKLTGDSDWRPFQLPAFINDGSERRPLKLTLNVVLPGEGKVELRGLKLQTLKAPMMGVSSVGLGRIAIVGLFFFALGVGVVVLIWRLRKRQAESELRRIQALDS